jgi:head-tail adaptor
MNDPLIGHLTEVVRTFLSDECFIQRPMVTINAAGLSVTSWATLSPVHCRLLPLKQRSNLNEVAEREAGKAQYKLILPADADVKNGDRVRVNDTIYEITEVKQDVTAMMFTECQVTRFDD